MISHHLPRTRQGGWGLISLILLTAVGMLVYLHREEVPGLLQQQLERYALSPTESSTPDTVLYRRNQVRIEALERQVNELDKTLDRIKQDERQYSDW